MFLKLTISMSALSILTIPMIAVGSAPTAVATKSTSEKSTTEKVLAIESGKVEFLAIGKPSFLKVNGVGQAPSGSMTISNGKAHGEFSFELGTLDTKNDARTGHMKEKYLEIEKFPKATLKFKDIALKDGTASESIKTDVRAELTLHGQTQPVTMTAELTGTDKKTATGSFKIRLTDYGIAIPSYAGITIADEVTVTIQSVMK